MAGEKQLKELFVEVTNQCHLSCIHCSSCASVNASESIPFDKLNLLIEQGLELGLERFTISGGEPLLYPHFFDLVCLLRRRGIEFCVYTCGVLKDSNNILRPISYDEISKIVDAKPSKMIFSLQGGTSSVHEYVNGVPGSYEVTIDSISRAVAAGLPVELHFVPMQVNGKDIELVVQTADKLGVSRVSLLRLVLQGRCTSELLLPASYGKMIAEEVEELRLRYPAVDIRLGAPFNCITMSGTLCSAAKNKLLISASGEVFPCEAFKFLRGTRPTIYNLQLRNIWLNDKLLNQLRALSDDGQVNNCIGCNNFTACGGGCPGERMLAYGDICMGPDPWCVKTTLTHKEG